MGNAEYMGSDDRKQMEEEKEKFDKLDKKGKEEWMAEAKKDLKGEGMPDEDVEKAAEMFEKNDMDGLMKMKRKMEKKKKDGDKKLAKPMKDEAPKPKEKPMPKKKLVSKKGKGEGPTAFRLAKAPKKVPEAPEEK